MCASWIVSLQAHLDTPPIQVVPYFTFFSVPALVYPRANPAA